MEKDHFAQEFSRRGLSHRLWRHPFFGLIQETGAYPTLKAWAIQAGRIDQVFAEILSNMLQNPSIPSQDHSPLRENLDDELGHGDSRREHFTLFKAVLRAMGITDEEYKATPMNEATRRIIDTLRAASLDSSNPLKILALMATEELICPQEFHLLLAELKKHIHPNSLTYFDVHIEADVRHAEDLIGLCYDMAMRTRQDLDLVFRWQEEDLDNNFQFYEDLMGPLN